MGLEAEGHFDAARLFYEKELLDDENNMVSPFVCTGTIVPDIWMGLGYSETSHCASFASLWRNILYNRPTFYIKSSG